MATADYFEARDGEKVEGADKGIRFAPWSGRRTVMGCDMSGKEKATNSREPWIDAEREFLERNYRSMPIAKIADKLGRTESAVRSYAQHIGLRKQWTDEELGILKTYYPEMGVKVAKMLPLRTKEAIEVRACILKLRKNFGENAWSEEELTILKREYGVYPAEQVAAKIGRSVSAIQAKIHKLRQEYKK